MDSSAKQEERQQEKHYGGNLLSYSDSKQNFKSEYCVHCKPWPPLLRLMAFGLTGQDRFPVLPEPARNWPSFSLYQACPGHLADLSGRKLAPSAADSLLAKQACNRRDENVKPRRALIAFRIARSADFQGYAESHWAASCPLTLRPLPETDSLWMSSWLLRFQKGVLPSPSSTSYRRSTSRFQGLCSIRSKSIRTKCQTRGHPPFLMVPYLRRLTIFCENSFGQKWIPCAKLLLQNKKAESRMSRQHALRNSKRAQNLDF